MNAADRMHETLHKAVDIPMSGMGIGSSQHGRHEQHCQPADLEP